MSTYSEHAQRELDAESFAADDKRRAVTTNIAGEIVPFKPTSETRRLPNVTVPRDTDLDDDITEAMYDALTDAEGHPSAFYLRHHLAQRGLLIVEADKYGAVKMALQLIGSCEGSAGKAASVALEKMER